MLTREAVADILTFCEDIHASKTELMSEKLKQTFSSQKDIDIQNVASAIYQIDNAVGLKDELLTEYKRDKYLKSHFKFIQPERVVIGKKNNIVYSYYRLPVVKTLNRLLQDSSIRKYLIQQPLFTNTEPKIYQTFSDGNLVREMNLHGQYIILRVYMDGFGVNCPIGSSSTNHKVLGVYYSPFDSLEVASHQSTVQTLALLSQKDVERFTLRICLEETMLDLKNLVNTGIFDKKMNKILQVRVMCSLGDNLEQNQIAGIKLNISKMQHSCRKCLVSRSDLCSAYADIHSKNHQSRTDEMPIENYQEKEEINRTHVNGVHDLSLYHDFPFFNVCKQLPQYSSHDLLEGCVKLWFKLILEHFVKSKWFSWDTLEKMMSTFPYRGSDANSRPATLRAKKMKAKESRGIIGTFSEVSNLIQSFPQVAYDYILDYEDLLAVVS